MHFLDDLVSSAADRTGCCGFNLKQRTHKPEVKCTCTN